MIRIKKRLRGKRIVRKIHIKAAESCRTLKNKSVAPLCLMLSATVSLSMLYSGASFGYQLAGERNEGYLGQDVHAAQEQEDAEYLNGQLVVASTAIKANNDVPLYNEKEYREYLQWKEDKRAYQEEVRRQQEAQRQQREQERIALAANTNTQQTAPSNPSGNVQLGQELAANRGYTGEQWNCLYHLWRDESGWDNHAANPISTAYGIPQFLNSTWASVGYQRTSDPHTQIQAGLDYIEGRYGTPCNARHFFNLHRYY